MKKWALPIFLFIILLIGGGIYLVNRNTTTTSQSTSNAAGSSNKTSGDAAKTINTVTLANFAFSPGNITVKQGTTVTWTNSDSMAHTVTESDGQKGPNSGPVAPGGTFTFTYDNVGTFPYHCTIHPSMTGTVTVSN